MTANHVHTPDSDHLGKLIWETIHNDVYETDLSYAGTNNLVAKIMSSKWLAEIEAAAEQRGAEQVIDHIRAEANDAAGQEWLHPDQELSDMADWLEERHRADRIANKEGER